MSQDEMPSGEELFGAKEIKIPKDFGIEGQALEDLKKPAAVELFPALRADQQMQLLKEQCQIFLRSNLLPKDMTWPQAFTIACFGKEIGLQPFESLQRIYIVHGKPGMDAQLMKRKVHEHLPNCLFDIVSYSETEAVIEACRDRNKDKPREFRMTRAEADQAGWTTKWNYKTSKNEIKDNWAKQPKTMLLWRLVSHVCRFVFSDCLGSIQYTPEELGAMVTEDGMPTARITGKIDAKAEDDLESFNQRMKKLGETEFKQVEVKINE